MSDPRQSHAPQSMATPEDVKAANERARKMPTRPGWRAVLVLIAFLAGMAFYVTHVGS